MALSDITLGKGEVLLTQSDSGLGIIPLDNTIMFGVIQAVNDLCDTVIVGDYVMFNPTKTRRLMYGSTIYYISTEENISGVETIIL